MQKENFIRTQNKKKGFEIVSNQGNGIKRFITVDKLREWLEDEPTGSGQNPATGHPHTGIGGTKPGKLTKNDWINNPATGAAAASSNPNVEENKTDSEELSRLTKWFDEQNKTIPHAIGYRTPGQ